MKKLVTLILTATMTVTLGFGLVGCNLTNPDKTPVHTHTFVSGVCDCGEIDPNHECVFFQGKCITCGKDDPYNYKSATGEYGVTAEVYENYTVNVATVDVKSEEAEEVFLVLEEGNVNILDKAWVMYNVTIQPEEGAEEGDVKLTTGKVSVPAPVPGVEEYVVYEVQEETVEVVESEYVENYVVVDCWDFNYNYLVTTEQSFNVVEYYENADADTTIPEHINVGEDKAEDAYQKGQTRTLEVYACLNGDMLLEDDYLVMVEGFTWREYNTLGKEIQYQQVVHLDAQTNLNQDNRNGRFLGWYIGEFEEDKIVLEEEPYSTDFMFYLEMPARDLKIFAVYGQMLSLRVSGQMSQISIDGEEFRDYDTAMIHPLKKSVTLDVLPLKNYYFSHWAYADDPYNPECFISDEPTFVYTVSGEPRGIVAVCEPYAEYTYSVFSACSMPMNDEDYLEYRFTVNGEDYFDDYYSGTFYEYETFTVTAVPVRGCKFVGWAIVGANDSTDYDICKDKIIGTDSTYVINKENCADFKYNSLVAVYEALPQYDFEAICYLIDDNYNSFASIYVDGQARGDNFYAARLAEGEKVTIKAVPEMNCKFEGWYYYTVDEDFQPVLGELAFADAEFTFTMGKENTRVAAKLRCYPTYSVSAYAGEGGDIYINGENHYGSIRQAYEEGEKLTVKIDVKEGFEFKGWYVNNSTHEQLLTTDLQFEYTVGTSDASFLAKIEQIIYYNVQLEIKSPALTVDMDDYTDLPYVPEGESHRVYVTMRREGDSVTIRAKDVEGEGHEFSHWMVNGEMIADREYTFTIGTKDVVIYAIARAEVRELELRLSNSLVCTGVYSTDYETGRRYISTISVNEGITIWKNESPANLFQGLTIIRHGEGTSRYENIFVQCDVDFGGAIEKDMGDGYMFDKPGRYTVTITDKSNPEISLSFTLQVVGMDHTGTYVWVSRTGKKYHVDPRCSDMQSVTAMTVAEAEEAGYEACKICCGNQ